MQTAFLIKLALVPCLWEAEETSSIILMIMYIYIQGPKGDKRKITKAVTGLILRP